MAAKKQTKVKKETKKKVDKKPKAPKPVKEAKGCGDKNCPIHGSLKTRGRMFKGQIISNKMNKTVTVGWDSRIYSQKYERYAKRRSKIKAHLPACIEVNVGDTVKLVECRPLSKTKKFVVIENESNKSKTK